MYVSVVVPTYRRPESLARCLDALAGQDTQPDEILVIVRDDDEVSRDCIERRDDRRVRLVSVRVQDTRPGFVAALNAGVRASHGDIVCLTDDDAEPHPDWIRRILAAFDGHPSVGAVGGRDWVYHDGRLEGGAEPIVGILRRSGRVIGRHHQGVGAPRDVEVLKGVNLSVRGELIRQILFDTRLLGVRTEHHSELGLCLRLRRMGYRVIYDPAIAVDHRPQPRIEESREHGRLETRNAAHNETLAVLEHLPAWRRPIYLMWAFAIGTSTTPGVAQTVRSFLLHRHLRWSIFAGAQAGRILGLRTYRRSRRAGPQHPQDGDRSGQMGDARTIKHRDEVLAIGHSPGAAARISQLLGDTTIAHQPPPGWRGMFASSRLVLQSRSPTLYLVDVGMSTTSAALLGRLTGKRVILDTGDAAFALARSLGNRGNFGLALVGIGEWVALHSAHEMIVRGRAHASLMPRPSIHIPDLPPEQARPVDRISLEATLDLKSTYVVGLVGSLIFSPRHRISYGWDLIEALARTAPPVVALIVGDGDGLKPLQAHALTLGVSDRCRFVGRVPVELVSEYVSLMDVAISTQTNDIVGQVRTTAKLPLYLACGCPVLASHVGEAGLLLGPLGWTIPYAGVVDHSYPARLAVAIETWRLDPAGQPARKQSALDLAAAEFDRQVMRARIVSLLSRGKV
jgi:GT2 family glycosyltransferase